MWFNKRSKPVENTATINHNKIAANEFYSSKNKELEKEYEALKEKIEELSKKDVEEVANDPSYAENFFLKWFSVSESGFIVIHDSVVDVKSISEVRVEKRGRPRTRIKSRINMSNYNIPCSFDNEQSFGEWTVSWDKPKIKDPKRAVLKIYMETGAAIQFTVCWLLADYVCRRLNDEYGQYGQKE